MKMSSSLDGTGSCWPILPASSQPSFQMYVRVQQRTPPLYQTLLAQQALFPVGGSALLPYKIIGLIAKFQSVVSTAVGPCLVKFVRLSDGSQNRMLLDTV